MKIGFGMHGYNIKFSVTFSSGWNIKFQEEGKGSGEMHDSKIILIHTDNLCLKWVFSVKASLWPYLCLNNVVSISNLDRCSSIWIFFSEMDLSSVFHFQIITPFPRIKAPLNSLKSNHGIHVISASRMHSQYCHA